MHFSGRRSKTPIRFVKIKQVLAEQIEDYINDTSQLAGHYWKII